MSLDPEQFYTPTTTAELKATAMVEPTVVGFELTVLREVFQDSLVVNVVQCCEAYQKH